MSYEGILDRVVRARRNAPGALLTIYVGEAELTQIRYRAHMSQFKGDYFFFGLPVIEVRRKNYFAICQDIR